MMKFMKHMLLPCWLILFLIIPGFCQTSVMVSWDPNTENDLAGYRIYYGSESKNYQHIKDVGIAVSNQITNLIPNTRYYFVLTAYDSTGNESGFSKEISILLDANSSEKSADSEKTLQITYNFPNPFQLNLQQTQIRYFITEETPVTIKILDQNGQSVKTILERVTKFPGEHTEDSWDGKNSKGEFVASGVYFCKIETTDTNKIFRIAVIR